jgi:SAM-dependent methyltransferase
VSHAFDEAYFVGGTRSNYRDYASVEPAIEIGFMPVVRRYAEAVKRTREHPVSLDVGCAYGFYVERLAAAGFDAHGVDVSEYAVERARARGVANVAVANAGVLPFPDASVDFVTCIDVIEHVPTEQSEAVAAEIHRVLRPGGIAFMATPNFLTNPYWNIYLPEFVDLDETHINYQSVESLRALLSAFSHIDVYGDTPFVDQFHAFDTSGAFTHPLLRMPPLRRIARRAAWKLLGRSVEWSSYLHAVAVR